MVSSLEARRRLDLLDRLLETTDLARIVPVLEPRILQQIVRRRGLESSGEIIALATSEQLLRVFDIDLWESDEPGGEERFDADPANPPTPCRRSFWRRWPICRRQPATRWGSIAW